MGVSTKVTPDATLALSGSNDKSQIAGSRAALRRARARRVSRQPGAQLRGKNFLNDKAGRYGIRQKDFRARLWADFRTNRRTQCAGYPDRSGR